ncbi:MAG TPA: hypothetical protein VJT09_15835 [Pyrinomonadaceae bacterium]|nr:hypothetical protein [Pyrinomonadaceae bacterium]
MVSPPTEAATLPEENNFAPPAINQEEPASFGDTEHARELIVWLRALRSFFDPGNYPRAEVGQADLIEHDWANELRIVRETLLRCSQLVFQSIRFDSSEARIFDETDGAGALDQLSPSSPSPEAKTGLKDAALLDLAAALGDGYNLCQSLLELRTVSLHAWLNLGASLDGQLGRQNGANLPVQLYSQREPLNIPPSLLDLTREAVRPATLGADILHIFSSLFRLLDYLRLVETFFRRDLPLKQTLPLFTLVHEEAQSLTEFIETRVLAAEGLERPLFEALDSTNYAVRMELRKVFARELVGISSLQQAPAVYVRIENAHGLLRDCFQQSVVGLVQLFSPALEGAQLFDVFRTKLEQSLALRRDLWSLLQLVRRIENEADPTDLKRLLKNLSRFREGSLRYLMFKDWETFERFMEEAETARGSAELAPLLHSFTAYLEALSSQVNMRAVLVDHPFDYQAAEDNSD